jgi:hypothetical protein
MTPPHEQDAPVAPGPRENLDNPPTVNVNLGTSVSGNTITITGNGAINIPAGQQATHINFFLNDTSGGQVQFVSLDAQDNSTSCPPTVNGNQSSQIVGVTMNNAPANNKSARFTDNNSNQGAMNISYQWNFSCSATFNVLPFDPIISNGGRIGGF